MASRVIPIILVGRQSQMGRAVTENLKPEIEVLHFISTNEAAKEDLPLLLQQKTPSHSPAGDVGTQQYWKPAEAVVLGLGYTNDAVDEIREACKDIRPGIPWLVGGMSQNQFQEMVRSGPMPQPETQGPITAQKVKKAVVEVLTSGKGGRDGVYVWHRE